MAECVYNTCVRTQKECAARPRALIATFSSLNVEPAIGKNHFFTICAHAFLTPVTLRFLKVHSKDDYFATLFHMSNLPNLFATKYLILLAQVLFAERYNIASVVLFCGV